MVQDFVQEKDGCFIWHVGLVTDKAASQDIGNDCKSISDSGYLSASYDSVIICLEGSQFINCNDESNIIPSYLSCKAVDCIINWTG